MFYARLERYLKTASIIKKCFIVDRDVKMIREQISKLFDFPLATIIHKRKRHRKSYIFTSLNGEESDIFSMLFVSKSCDWRRCALDTSSIYYYTGLSLKRKRYVKILTVCHCYCRCSLKNKISGLSI